MCDGSPAGERREVRTAERESRSTSHALTICRGRRCVFTGRPLGAELGDLLFSVVNLARHLDVDPEAALRRANERFARRYRHVEEALARLGAEATGASPELLDRLGASAKADNP